QHPFAACRSALAQHPLDHHAAARLDSGDAAPPLPDQFHAVGAVVQIGPEYRRHSGRRVGDRPDDAHHLDALPHLALGQGGGTVPARLALLGAGIPFGTRGHRAAQRFPPVHRVSVISGPRSSDSSPGRLAGDCASSREPGRCSGSKSRGGRGCSPRTTTTSPKMPSMSIPACSEASACPVSTPRRNQRGPSTPRNRAGRWPLRPSGSRTGSRASSSSPKTPLLMLAEPPCLLIWVCSSSR